MLFLLFHYYKFRLSFSPMLGWFLHLWMPLFSDRFECREFEKKCTSFIFFGCSGLATGIYATNSPEACQAIALSAECNVIVVENDLQLKKILSVWSQLPQLKAVVQYKGTLEKRIANVYTVRLSRLFFNFKPIFCHLNIGHLRLLSAFAAAYDFAVLSFFPSGMSFLKLEAVFRTPSSMSASTSRRPINAAR